MKERLRRRGEPGAALVNAVVLVQPVDGDHVTADIHQNLQGRAKARFAEGDEWRLKPQV
jgi:hypothetical protein